MRHSLLLLLMAALTGFAYVTGRLSERGMRDPGALIALLLTVIAFVALYLLIPK